ncbi:hypothetical protein CesoFtcFv8_004096 [Champsocephalus esox]|uniref:Uncharacterized protein n=1 Tax=Champsocephalus esox TaxID=159716 RepID=A0AAN8CZI7_9TELE|nr:hypothetical protein CesoFtcFv8_004096 [Champsocephalus esox]
MHILLAYVRRKRARQTGPISPLSQVSPVGVALSSPPRPPVSEPFRRGARQRGDRGLRLQCTAPHTAERHTGRTTEQLAPDRRDASPLGAMLGRE